MSLEAVSHKVTRPFLTLTYTLTAADALAYEALPREMQGWRRWLLLIWLGAVGGLVASRALFIDASFFRPSCRTALHPLSKARDHSGIIQMLVRPAVATDVADLALLIGELGYPTSTEEMAARMAAVAGRSDIATFVADFDGAIGGMITVSVSPSLYRSDLLGAITVLVVSSAFRGRGIAAVLVTQGETWLREQGARRAAVHPSTARADAHRLYARLGYEATGSRLTKSLE